MECEINGCKFKYENDQLYRYIVKRGNQTLKNPYWNDIKFNPGEDGYMRINCCKKKYLLHRIIYYIHNLEWDINNASFENQIDHIDRNRSRNIISNLRISTHAENMRNKMGRGTRKRGNKFRAMIITNKKTKHLGTYDTEEEAHQVYLDAKKNYHYVY